MIQIILETLWLLAPAGVANMAPPIAAYYNVLPKLDLPVDGGVVIGKKRIFGPHKTVRGFIVGIICGGIAGMLQYTVRDIPFIESISLLYFSSVGSAFLFGVTTSFGALLGDAMKSFFKRRLHIPAGTSWKPFDQIDFVAGALVAMYFFVSLSVLHVVVALVVVGVITFFVSVAGVALRIKQSV